MCPSGAQNLAHRHTYIDRRRVPPFTLVGSRRKLLWRWNLKKFTGRLVLLGTVAPYICTGPKQSSSFEGELLAGRK
jgi:hypothetical protein